MIHAETHIDIATRLDDIAVLIGTEQNKEIELHIGDVVEKPGLGLSTYSTVLEQTAQCWRQGITAIGALEHAMDNGVLRAIDAASQEIALRRKVLEMGAAARERAIAASQIYLAKARAKVPAVLNAFDSLVENQASRANTLFQNEFAKKMRDVAYWREKWEKEGIEIGWREKAKAITERGRQALVDKIQPSLERILQAEMAAWVQALPDKLTEYPDASEAQLFGDLDRAFDAFEAGLKQGDLHLKHIDDRDVVARNVNWKRLTFEAIGLGLEDIHTDGVVYTPDTKAFLIHIQKSLSPTTLMINVIAPFITPILPSLIAGKARIADEARKYLGAASTEIGEEIERVTVESFAAPREKLAAVLEGEVTGRETRLETLIKGPRAGNAPAEETRLARIESALRSQFEELSQRTYGKVLTDTEIRTRIEPDESSSGESSAG